jgi:putative N-acetylmannosamine-6-phosphate epimerase
MKRGLIVSIQGYTQELTQNLADMIKDENIAAIRTDRHIYTNIPLIALKKNMTFKYYITPTIEDLSHCQWGNYTAIDCRKGNDNIVKLFQMAERYNQKIVADIECLDDVLNILELQKNDKIILPSFFATTFSFFHTGGELPDLELIKEITKNTFVPVIAEGKYKTPIQVLTAYEMGAHNVCIGAEISDIKYLVNKFNIGAD